MTVDVGDTDGVRIVSLNRPQRHNAMDDETGAAFSKAFAEAAADNSVKVILLRGEGPSFCSGRDVSQLGQRAGGESDYVFVRASQEHRLAIFDCIKPVIAAVKGHVLGGGLEMALSADIRIASTDLRMAFPEIRYGLMTDTGGSPLTTMLAGPSRAKLMLMTGRAIDAQRALAWGMVDEVVEPDELDETALNLCREIAGNSELSVASIKQIVNENYYGAVHAGVRAELLAQVALFSSPEYLELKKQRQAAKKG